MSGLGTDPGHLHPDTAEKLKLIRANCPELEATTGHVRGFATMMRHLHSDRLPAWITAVRDDALRYLRQFAAGLTLSWNSGQAEGQNIRLLSYSEEPATAPRPEISSIRTDNHARATVIAALSATESPIQGGSYCR